MALGDILLHYYDPNNPATLLYTYRIKNRDSFDVDLSSVSTVFEVADSPKEETILLKIQGNRLIIIVKWRIKDTTTSVVDQAGVPNYPITTAVKQIFYLINTIENKSITNKYRIELDSVTPTFVFDGSIESLKLTQTTPDASTWQATLMFVVGKVLEAEP